VIPWPDNSTVPDDVKARLEAMIVADGGLLGKGLSTAFPDGWAEGQTRADNAGIQEELEDLLHFAFRVTNYQTRRYAYGSDKVIFRLYISGSLSLLNLGTGETLGTRTLTAMGNKEIIGSRDALTESESLELEQSVAVLLTNRLVDDVKERLSPGMIQATVAGQHRGRVVLARGYLDGGFRGEIFKTAKGHTLRVTSVQERLSLADWGGSGPPPTAGTGLSRHGAPSKGANAPRLMVFVPEPEMEVAPGVSAAELGQWFSDDLVESQFVVIPMAADLFKSKQVEAAIVNVDAAKIGLGAMVKPDILVVPEVLRYAKYEQRDDEREADVFILELVVSCTFIDVATGTVLYGTTTSLDKSEVLQDWGRSTDVEESFKKLVMDASRGLAGEAGKEFKPRRAYGKVKSAADANGQITWTLDSVPLGLGTVAEVLMRSKEFKDPSTGESIGFVEDLIGTVKVTGSKGKASKEQGQVVIATVPLGPGHRVRAVVGTASSDRRIVRMGDVSIEISGAPGLTESEVRTALSGALHTNGHFRTALGAHGRQVLKQAGAELGSGSYQVDDSTSEMPMEAATHQVDLQVKASAAPAKTKGKMISRDYRFDVTASLTDLESGEGTMLNGCKTCPTSVYTMWEGKALKARQVKGKVVMGLRDEDAGNHVKGVAFKGMTELMRRLRLLSDKAK